MKMSEVEEIIEASQRRGYRVAYEKAENGMLASGYFPDRDEEPFDTADEAWTWATKFAHATLHKYVNIYVVDINYVPVSDYKERMIPNR